jgi:hypothetical protein
MTEVRDQKSEVRGKTTENNLEFGTADLKARSQESGERSQQKRNTGMLECWEGYNS